MFFARKELCRSRFNHIFVTLLLVAAVSIGLAAAGTEVAAGGSTIFVDGEPLELVKPSITVDGRVFVPVLDLATGLQAKLVFYQDVAVTLSKDDFEIVLRVDNPAAVINRVTEVIEEVPFIAHWRIYVPLRLTAQTLGFEVGWDSETQSVLITRSTPEPTPPTVLEVGPEAESVPVVTALWEPESISDHDLLSLEPQQPHVPCSDEEFELLVRVINAEAYGEPQDGRIAVGNVVVNRVLNPKFPNTIREVLLAPGQFRVFDNGHVNRSIRPEAYEAAREALYGADRSLGALFFHNPAVSRSRFWSGRPVTVEIGAHRFSR